MKVDIWNAMNANRERIGQLDSSLVNEMSKESKEIIQTIKSWQKDVNSTINSAVNRAASAAASYYGGYSGGGGTYNPNSGNSLYIGQWWHSFFHFEHPTYS